MKEFICIIWDDFILFNKSIGQLTNCGWSTPIEQFVSDMGLVIPMGLKTLSAFSLSGRMLSNPVVENDIIKCTDIENVREYGFGMTILPSGKVISICIQSLEPFRFLTNIIPTGSGLRYGISFDSGSSDALYGFVRNSQSINECFAKFCEMNPLMYQDHYRIFKISELVLWIGECLKYKAILPFDGFEIKPSTKATDVINILEPKEIRTCSISELADSVFDESWKKITEKIEDDICNKMIDGIKNNDYLAVSLGKVPNTNLEEYYSVVIDKSLRYYLSKTKLKYAGLSHTRLGGISLNFDNIPYNMLIVDNMHDILSLKNIKLNDVVIVKYGDSFNCYQNISGYNTSLGDWKFIRDIKESISIPYQLVNPGYHYDVNDESEMLNLNGIKKGVVVKIGSGDERKYYINHTGNNQSLADWILGEPNNIHQNHLVNTIDFDYGGI